MAKPIKLTGFRELERALAEELPKTTAKGVLRRTATKSMKRIEDGMASRAPYDPQDRDEDGRHLNETMTTQVVKARRRRGSKRFDAASGVEVLTGPAPTGKRARRNASWQENGTVKMAAQPYARPTADAEGLNVIDDVKEILTVEIEKSKARIRRKAAKG